MEPATIAVDTGGTFTDVVCLAGGTLHRMKVASTPGDPAAAVLEGVARIREVAGLPAGAPFILVHGSTVATNALLERRGARVALVTNHGLEDVIEIGRQTRPQLYALVGHRPPPLVAAADRHGIAGRLGPDGEEEQPLDPAELAALPERLAGAEAVAICLLHSYADTSHERLVAAALEGLGVPLAVSSTLLPEYREYERTATTVVNAYVAPRMERYLGRLDGESGAVRVRIMASGGGTVPVARARKEAVHTVLSGPAGGVVGALARAKEAGFDNLLTFDMGGTSTDVSICPGRPLHTREFQISGVPVAVPVIDIHTVGSGGGSIARLDAAGALRVGPESAGAEPGPICYGRGGHDVTVTDAHVWLGRLPPDAFLGGERRLDVEAVRRPLAELATSLGTSPEQAAEGVLAVADSAMEGALRVISVERGYDPADFTLVPFGGAAGLHAAELARRLGIPRVLVPAEPGVLSAYGMLVSPVRKDLARTVLLRGEAASRGHIATELDALAEEAARQLVQEGFGTTSLAVRRTVDARYVGQSYELRVPAEGWEAAFHEAHRARYGYARVDAPIEAVTLRVEATAPPPELPERRVPRGGGGTPVSERRDVAYRSQMIRARVLARETTPVGARIDGPAVITEYSATTWVPPDWSAEVLDSGAFLLSPIPA